MFSADQNIWKRFIISQKHIVLRLELFDQILFQQERFSFGLGGQKHHTGGLADHAADARRMPLWPRIACNAIFQTFGLANVKDPALPIEHAIDPRRAIKAGQIVSNQIVACRSLCVICHYALSSMRFAKRLHRNNAGCKK